MMLGILYLIGAFAVGLCIANAFGEKIKIIKEEKNSVWMYVAMAMGIGYIVAGWVTYLVSYFCKVKLGMENPKLWGNAAASVLMAAAVAALVAWGVKGKLHFRAKDKKQFAKEAVLFGALFAFILGTMFYVFYEKDGKLYSGATVFSDFSPHTAMIRSFSLHDNFPTQYPHYGGEDVKYHFMFQFLSGNLEYLGLRIDWAFNLTSAASLWGFLVLLYYLAKKIAGRALAGVISVAMMFCRSSFAVFQKIYETFANGGTVAEFFQNSAFIGSTEHEDWGLWNYNVFLNQRHLGLGLLIGIIAVMYFYNYLDWLDGGTEKLGAKAKRVLFSKEAWRPEAPGVAAAMGVLLGGIAFWNGAAEIGALLILLGFAIFSRNKLDYLVAAAIAVIMSYAQTRFFMDSGANTVSFAFQFGFLAQNKSILGVAEYLVTLAGIFFVGAVLFLAILKGKRKALALAFLLPTVFAFTISMTPDITVNHKYVIISELYLNTIWAYALTKMFYSRAGNAFVRTGAKITAAALFFILTATGAYDLLTIKNADKQRVAVDENSSVKKWLSENLTEDDLVLTAEYSMSDVTLSGIMMYNGWPYYAWSAGYDTDSRAEDATVIYTSPYKEDVLGRVQECGIDYIVFEQGMGIEGEWCFDTTIKELFRCVYDDGLYQIYDTKEVLYGYE